MKLFTTVENGRLPVSLSLKDRIAVLGSCFADNIGDRLDAAGFSVCVNPFGTLYNPASIANSIERLASGKAFLPEDCVEMGAGAGLVCSFSHHTRFARPDASGFLDNANARLSEAASFWKECNKVIITLGTAQVWKHGGKTVSNCLKRPASEFRHEMLTMEEVGGCLDRIASESGKEFIFTVSPIRHLSNGAHTNTVSKSILHLALHGWQAKTQAKTAYFPAYEIMLDELRDYRFCSEDLCHPNPQAVEYLWEKFLEAAALPDELAQIRLNEKANLKEKHRTFLRY